MMALRVIGALLALVAGYFLLKFSFEAIGPLPTIAICAGIAIVLQIVARRRR